MAMNRKLQVTDRFFVRYLISTLLVKTNMILGMKYSTAKGSFTKEIHILLKKTDCSSFEKTFACFFTISVVKNTFKVA